MNPGSARLPVSSISRSSPSVSSISAHSSPVRWSFHRIAGRSTFPRASSATSPCIWPERPIPAGAPHSARSRSSTDSVARHQSSGSCSDQPARGVESGYSASARAHHGPLGVDRNPFDRRGAHVDSDEHVRQVCTNRGRSGRAVGSLRRAMREGLGRNPDYSGVSHQAVDVAIGAAAERQHGNVTTRQLLAFGLDDSAIAYRVTVGRLYRVHRGVYSIGRRATTPLERASAAVLACGPGAALSHASAMTLWGYWKRWDEPFEVSVSGDRRRTAVKVHRTTTLHWRDVTTQLGIRATTPARTIFDVAPRLDDRALKRKVNEALHSPWLDESDLAELIDRFHHLLPARRIAPLIGLSGTPTRAGWEDDFPAFCVTHGLPIAGHGCSHRRLHRRRGVPAQQPDRRARQLASSTRTGSPSRPTESETPRRSRSAT